MFLQLKEKLTKLEDEKEQTKVILEDEYNKKKEDIGKSFITRLLEKEALIGKLKNENGIFSKTHIL